MAIIEIVTDHSATIGMGHYVRSIAIAVELDRRGHEVIMTAPMQARRKEADLVVTDLPGCETINESVFEMAVIRDDIRTAAKKVSTNTIVLIMIGGADINNESREAARVVHQYDGYPLIIGGRYSRHCDVRVPFDVAARMAACSWAVTNGGTTMMEFIHMGKPVWALPQTYLERQLAMLAFQKGAIIGVASRVEDIRPPSDYARD